MDISESWNLKFSDFTLHIIVTEFDQKPIVEKLSCLQKATLSTLCHCWCQKIQAVYLQSYLQNSLVHIQAQAHKGICSNSLGHPALLGESKVPTLHV